MGKQYNKLEKKNRRKKYNDRKKEQVREVIAKAVITK
jgi:hypothetical protein